MATSTIKRMADIEDVTNKLTFTALAKSAYRVGNRIFFQAEVYFDSYIADYSYTLAVDSSIRPKSVFAPLSAIMVDTNFTPRGVVASWATANGVFWRANSQNGNYLLVSGSWLID